jgi:endonuclease III
MPTVPETRLRAVCAAILKAPRYPRDEWGWIGDQGLKYLTKKRANKFLFACILDYQMNADRLWARCQAFLEDELHDPDSLWEVVADTPLSSWLRRTRNFGLHRFQDAAHRRVWVIGRRVLDEFAGDARLIWRGKTAAEAAEVMEALGVDPNISRMAAGALADTGWIKGPSDVKADVHVCRTLGRSLVGNRLDPSSAVSMAREVYPRNPWRLDGPLYEIGKAYCFESAPSCSECPLKKNCAYALKLRTR